MPFNKSTVEQSLCSPSLDCIYSCSLLQDQPSKTTSRLLREGGTTETNVVSFSCESFSLPERDHMLRARKKTHSCFKLANVCFSLMPCAKRMGTTLIFSPCLSPSSFSCENMSWARSNWTRRQLLKN